MLLTTLAFTQIILQTWTSCHVKYVSNASVLFSPFKYFIFLRKSCYWTSINVATPVVYRPPEIDLERVQIILLSRLRNSKNLDVID